MSHNLGPDQGIGEGESSEEGTGEDDELDGGYADLASKDQEVYYRNNEETMKDD